MQMKSFAVTEQGASHIKRGKPCEDHSASYSDENCAIAVVCDGHGGDDYVRSKRGSKFGCEVAVRCIRTFIAEVDEEDLRLNHERLIHNLAGSIISAWNDDVRADYEKEPFREEELAIVSAKARRKYESGKIESAYGTTMIAVVSTKNYWFGIHIGDGKCVEIGRDSVFSQPIPWDNRCFLNATTSICDSDALMGFRQFYSQELPAAVFVGSDGIDDCFKTDEQLYNLYKPVLYSFANFGFNSAVKELKEFLPRLSAKGSGDDMSVAAILDLDAIGEIDIIKNYSRSEERTRKQKNEELEAQRLEEERKRIEEQYRRAEEERKKAAEKRKWSDEKRRDILEVRKCAEEERWQTTQKRKMLGKQPAKFCVKCGKPVEPDDNYCGQCGFRIGDVYQDSSDARYCTKCGSMIFGGYYFCDQCGENLADLALGTDPRYCTNCGGTVYREYGYCRDCGTPVQRPTRSQLNAPDVRHCTACSAPILPGYKFCRMCSERVKDASIDPTRLPEVKHCTQCGAAVLPEYKYCGHCGKLIHAQSSDPSEYIRVRYCTKCGTPVYPSYMNCRECGEKVKTPVDVQTNRLDLRFCTNCGKGVIKGYQYCAECGRPVPEYSPDVSDKPNASYCTCKAVLLPGFFFCGKCGKRTSHTPQPVITVNNTTEQPTDDAKKPVEIQNARDTTEREGDKQVSDGNETLHAGESKGLEDSAVTGKEAEPAEPENSAIVNPASKQTESEAGAAPEMESTEVKENSAAEPAAKQAEPEVGAITGQAMELAEAKVGTATEPAAEPEKPETSAVANPVTESDVPAASNASETGREAETTGETANA